MMGRPTKYRKRYCKELINHMERGLSFETFGAVIDVNVDTLYAWTKKHLDFSEAKSRAFNKCRLFWEQKGIEGLWTQTLRKGNMSTTKSMNARIWEMNIKQRFTEWKDPEKKAEDIPTQTTRLVIDFGKDE